MVVADILKKYFLKIRGLVHVGAHQGYEHDLYLEHGIKNIMYFEPILNNYQILKQKIDDKAIAHNVALGNKVGQVLMYVETDNNGMSCSIMEPIVHLTQYPWIRFNNRELVVLDRLENYNINNNLYNMLIIDAQGYELEVLKGASDTLSGYDYIMTEINRDELYRDCAKIEQINEYLAKYRFDLIEYDWHYGNWGDAFYINRSAQLFYQ